MSYLGAAPLVRWLYEAQGLYEAIATADSIPFVRPEEKPKWLETVINNWENVQRKIAIWELSDATGIDPMILRKAPFLANKHSCDFAGTAAAMRWKCAGLPLRRRSQFEEKVKKYGGMWCVGTQKRERMFYVEEFGYQRWEVLHVQSNFGWTCGWQEFTIIRPDDARPVFRKVEEK